MEDLRIAETSIWSFRPAVQSPPHYKLWAEGCEYLITPLCLKPIFAKEVSMERSWIDVRQILSQGSPRASECVSSLTPESAARGATIVP